MSTCFTEEQKGESPTDGNGSAIIDPTQVGSGPDLYLAKIRLEERLKTALNFDFGFDSPINYVKRFFQCAFSRKQ